MARREHLGQNVFDLALMRMLEIYDAGHRPVVSVSGGKDSTVCMEITIEAARMTGNLPVDVVTRDEEIMFPGTYEYLERVAQRPEVSFHWLYACQPIINAYNRREPYFWVFDPLLPSSAWVRTPPPFAELTPDKHIAAVTDPRRFPPAEGRTLFAVVGLRASESIARKYSVYAAKGHMTLPNKWGVRNVRPIYDWQDGDVWKAIGEFGWDYNRAYDTLMRMGVPTRALRIAPPTMNAAGAAILGIGASAWPKWFDRVADRLPGVRTGAQYGKRAVLPARRHGETWQDCYQRQCIDEAPEWIADRARIVARKVQHTHGRHSTTPLPEVTPCRSCSGPTGSWKNLAYAMYGGDPFAARQRYVSHVEPEFFRAGAGTWGGAPTF